TGATEALIGGEHRRERGPVPAVGEEQVQEAGSRDLEALELLAEALGQSIAESLRQLTRRRARDGSEQQGGVRGVVPEAWLGRALERYRLVGADPLGKLAGDGQHRLAQAGFGRHRTHWRGSYGVLVPAPVELDRAHAKPSRKTGRSRAAARKGTCAPSPARVAILGL